MKKLFLLVLFLPTAFVLVGQSFEERLSNSAIELTNQEVIYDPSYFSIPYPNGDVPSDRGVCTDVIIRAYRQLGIDLQKEVHEDMKYNFDSYPKNWGLTSTDRNIDHRRVPNLMTFFERNGEVKPTTTNSSDYNPGDIVSWNLGRGTLHIGLVVDKKSHSGKNYLVVHNIGTGQIIEDVLFQYQIIGHYVYQPN